MKENPIITNVQKPKDINFEELYALTSSLNDSVHQAVNVHKIKSMNSSNFQAFNLKNFLENVAKLLNYVVQILPTAQDPKE